MWCAVVCGVVCVLTASAFLSDSSPGGEFCSDRRRYLLSKPSKTISCSVSGATSPAH